MFIVQGVYRVDGVQDPQELPRGIRKGEGRQTVAIMCNYPTTETEGLHYLGLQTHEDQGILVRECRKIHAYRGNSPSKNVKLFPGNTNNRFILARECSKSHAYRGNSPSKIVLLFSRDANNRFILVCVHKITSD